jgi:hypothetical protein
VTSFRGWMAWGAFDGADPIAQLPLVKRIAWSAVMAWSPRRGPLWQWARGIYGHTVTEGMRWLRERGR